MILIYYLICIAIVALLMSLWPIATLIGCVIIALWSYYGAVNAPVIDDENMEL